MNSIAPIFFKEIADNFRDRRTMLSALVFGPLFGPIIFAVFISLSLDQATSKAEEPLPLAVVGAEYAPNLVEFLEQQDTELERLEISADEATELVRQGEQEFVLVIPENYANSWAGATPARVSLITDGSDSASSRQADRAQRYLSAWSQQIGAMRLLARGVDPSIVRPINVDYIDTSTPSSRAGLILGMLSYFLLFAMLAGGMYLAIDTTAGERERGSLEPLLTLPVSRATLLIGKLSATCFFMSLSLAIALISLGVVLKFVPLQQLGMSVNFGPAEVITAYLMLLPFALVGAALMTVVASFTKSFKEAQSYVTFAMFVPTLPIMVAAVMNLKSSAAWMVVPSMSQHLLLLDLIKDEPLQPLNIVISVVSTLTLGVLLSYVAVRFYQREKLLM